MRNPFLIFLFILIIGCKKETKNVDYLTFKRLTLSYGHTMNNESLTVHIENYQNDNIHVNYQYIKPNESLNPNDISFKSYKIDSFQLKKIEDLVLKIDRNNIEKETETSGKDGSSTGISFYKKNSNTLMHVYPVWTPNSETKKRKLDDYMLAYKEIAKLAFIDSDSLLFER